jgi:tetratricopeptide (TPR) repeat protein
MKCGVAAIALFAISSPASATAIGQTPSASAEASPAEPSYDHFMPPLETVALPAEQPVLAALVAKARTNPQDPAQILAAMDDALAKLPSPTRLRGYIQFARSHVLEAVHRDNEAVEAAEESVELLPGYSAPLIQGFNLNAYLNRTGPAADYLMRAIDTDPVSATAIDDYEIDNLLRRLRGFRDDARERAISDRLLQIGWIGKHVDSRSNLAVDAIMLHLANHDVAGARTLVPKLLAPTDSRKLLIRNASAELWPDVEAWAGAKLERQWPIYLAEAKARWSAGKTTVAARDYLAALKSAGDYETAAREFLPMFDDPKADDADLVFMVSPLARALAHLGRWGDADALYERAAQIWPIDSDANALNVSANHALLLMEEGRFDQALALMDQSLAQTRRWGPNVGVTAFAQMEHNRACMLHELGRDGEARVSMAQALALERGSEAADLQLCMGDRAAAKRALLDALGNETTRDDVISFMQIPNEAPLDSPYTRKHQAEFDALRADPEIRQAVLEYGRILPWRLNEALTAKR